MIRSTSRIRRSWLYRISGAAIPVYLGMCLVAYLAQNWLLFAAHASQGKTDSRIRPPPGTEVLSLRTAQGVPVVAIYGKALTADGTPDPHPERRPTILYFYGNGGAIAWSWNEFDLFRQLDANVMIPDYVGYGASGGSPSEKSLYATADSAYDYLRQRPDIDHAKIIAVGWSLGGAVAIDLASRRPVAGLATFNAFVNLPEVAHHLLPWLPTRGLISYSFDNLNKIADVHCPVLICNGAHDTLVAPSMSDRLAAAAGGPVTRLVLPLADHNTVFTANRLLLKPALQRFVNVVAH